MVRVSRIGRLLRILRLTKIFSLLKGFLDKNSMKTFVNKTLRLDVGIERLILILLVLSILMHLSTCIWYYFIF